MTIVSYLYVTFENEGDVGEWERLYIRIVLEGRYQTYTKGFQYTTFALEVTLSELSTLEILH